jgi:hypothetical protein
MHAGFSKEPTTAPRREARSTSSSTNTRRRDEIVAWHGPGQSARFCPAFDAFQRLRRGLTNGPIDEGGRQVHLLLDVTSQLGQRLC